MDPEPAVASQESESDSLSVVDRTNNDGGRLAQPAQSSDTRLQAGPILAGSYPVQGGDFRYGPVCARVQRAFRYQRQTYRAVQGRLQEYWCRYKARELTTSQCSAVAPI